MADNFEISGYGTPDEQLLPKIRFALKAYLVRGDILDTDLSSTKADLDTANWLLALSENYRQED